MADARPILKWPGGKTDSSWVISRHLPRKISTYFEPFFGGGAVFFRLARQGRFERAVLSDSCSELIEMYRAVRDDVEGVIAAIQRLGPGRITEAKYYRIRASKPRTAAGKAARMIFLNKNGFNGLYRVNRAGEFNVPWAHRTKWRPDVANLRAVSAVLQGVKLVARDFAHVGGKISMFGDAVYFDPPYLPESKTARFAGYTPHGFDFEQQKRLAALFDDLAAKGVHVVASNADVRATMHLYQDNESTQIYRLKVKRRINRNGDGRGTVGELLMVNPGQPGEKRNDVKE